MLSLSLVHRSILVVMLAGGLLTGCGLNRAPASDEKAGLAGEQGEPAPEISLAIEEEPAVGAIEEELVSVEEEFELVEAPAADEVDVVAEAAATSAPLATATMAEAEMGLEADRAAGGVAMEAQQPVDPLKAGEVDDNARWDDYLLYRRNYRGPQVHDREVSERYIIEVEDGQGNPVLGALVRINLPGQDGREIYQARTYANGRVLFHPLALEEVSLEQFDRFLVEIEKDDIREEFTLSRLEAQTTFTERWKVTLDTRQQADSIDLDVLFLIDATGSMADEIAKIQDTIFDVAARIDALPGEPNVRYGMVTYRDREDSFVTRPYEFTPDVREFHANLSTVRAEGGGDTPESLNEALHDALHSVEWRGGNTIQLIFLVADAPPHLDYAQDYDYAVEMENAARRGIKIFPIASSGLDDQGEYIFRQLAQFTQGRFVFLTYEDPTNGGAPGETTTHHVKDYSVANLDDLLVKLVEEELAWQSPSLAQGQ